MQTDKVTAIKTPDSKLTGDDQESAEVLCNYFKDVFVKEGFWNGNPWSTTGPRDEDRCN